MASPLAAYLDSHSMTCTEFARRIGVKDSTVWRWVYGRGDQRRSPSLRLALDIERETSGAVPVSAWRAAPRRARVRRSRREAARQVPNRS